MKETYDDTRRISPRDSKKKVIPFNLSDLQQNTKLNVHVSTTCVTQEDLCGVPIAIGENERMEARKNNQQYAKINMECYAKACWISAIHLHAIFHGKEHKFRKLKEIDSVRMAPPSKVRKPRHTDVNFLRNPARPPFCIHSHWHEIDVNNQRRPERRKCRRLVTS